MEEMQNVGTKSAFTPNNYGTYCLIDRYLL